MVIYDRFYGVMLTIFSSSTLKFVRQPTLRGLRIVIKV